jgi:hypothetical protein
MPIESLLFILKIRGNVNIPLLYFLYFFFSPAKQAEKKSKKEKSMEVRKKKEEERRINYMFINIGTNKVILI